MPPRDRDYTDEQRQWLKAIDRLMTKLGRQPTLIEAFRLAKQLGYRRDKSK